MAAELEPKPMTMRQYRALADFRYELRRFLRYSEELTRRHAAIKRLMARWPAAAAELMGRV